MDTPDKNRIPAVSFLNFEDSPVFQYINDLSPIEPLKPARPENISHSLAFTSPSSLFSSPLLSSSRFSMKRHRSQVLSSPVVLIGETVKNSPDALEAVKITGLSEEQLPNVSESKPFHEQICLAIELANSLKHGRDGVDVQMASSDDEPMDADIEIGRSGGSRELSDELCIQSNDPADFDADSEVVLQTEEMEAHSVFGTEKSMFDVAGIQNSEQQIPKITAPIFDSFASEPQQFSICCNNSANVVDPGCSYSVQVAAGAPDITLSSSPKQRSVRRRCLTFDVGGSHKRIPLRDSTNDLSLDLTSINKAPSPQECSDTSKQDTDGILPLALTIGLHLNGLVNPSVSGDRNKKSFKDGRFFPLGPTTFHHNIEDEYSTPVSTKRDLVYSDIKFMESPERSLEGKCFDQHMATEYRQLFQGLDELGSCKRCNCRKSKCLKLYCDCFSAGLYCVEPCSCQDCFNKPIHEDLVMKTREVIEARNPLAFAPKVVSTSNSAINLWDENSKTPASARHTRGCNCKKSGCLKKYCECFMMGVGCSSNCRCMGCKNNFDHTNEKCAGESDAVTINDEVKDNDYHGGASSSGFSFSAKTKIPQREREGTAFCSQVL
ncbi:PREDICTED: protein tesmin/TSO1-like CXC 4 isoform X2 [Camelina sativa]|uniref:Protein tesmin/TSO1-like CXC 4 isoform X2 n=1 Tax=Camelina sativa TaxID=90675 RepID=A0ABM0T190_CAMSA|nr:PREDICTED: protein tesmin/TSO1-like CXC 4 isoform X2 [Camelina sativa]